MEIEKKTAKKHRFLRRNGLAYCPFSLGYGLDNVVISDELLKTQYIFSPRSMFYRFQGGGVWNFESRCLGSAAVVGLICSVQRCEKFTSALPLAQRLINHLVIRRIDAGYDLTILVLAYGIKIAGCPC